MTAEPADDLTRPVIGAAMTVLHTLRPGLEAHFYEAALVIELRRQGFACEQRKEHDVYYDGESIGIIAPALIVGERLVVEPWVVADFDDGHLARMLSHLHITGLPTGLLLNFKGIKLGIKRVSKPGAAY